LLINVSNYHQCKNNYTSFSQELNSQEEVLVDNIYKSIVFGLGLNYVLPDGSSKTKK